MSMSNPMNDAGDVSNNTIYNLLLNKILPMMTEFSQHLGQINGHIDHLRNRAESHSGDLKTLAECVRDTTGRVQVLEAASEQVESNEKADRVVAEKLAALEATVSQTSRFRDREIDGIGDRQARTFDRVWEIGMKVAGSAAMVGILISIVMYLLSNL